LSVKAVINEVYVKIAVIMFSNEGYKPQPVLAEEVFVLLRTPNGNYLASVLIALKNKNPGAPDNILGVGDNHMQLVELRVYPHTAEDHYLRHAME
jgi:hypothetical protein